MNEENNHERLAGIVAISLLTIIFIMGLISCNPVKKAIVTLDKHPLESAAYCDLRFPIKETFAKGDTILTTDTLWGLHTDTVVTTTKDTVTLTITKEKIVTNTKTISDTVFRENTARVEKLNILLQQREETINQRDKKITEQQSLVDNYKGKAHRRNLYLWLLIVVFGIWTFRKTIAKYISLPIKF
jgi:hypothetical protein